MITCININQEFVDNIFKVKLTTNLKNLDKRTSFFDIVDYMYSESIDITLMKFENKSSSYGLLIKDIEHKKFYAYTENKVVDILKKLLYNILDNKYMIPQNHMDLDMEYFASIKIFEEYIKLNFNNIIKDLIWKLIQETTFYGCLNHTTLDKIIRLDIKDNSKEIKENNIPNVESCVVRIYDINSEQEINLIIPCFFAIDDKAIADFISCLEDVIPINDSNIFVHLFDNILHSISSYFANYIDSNCINGCIFVQEIITNETWISEYDNKKKDILKLVVKSLNL